MKSLLTSAAALVLALPLHAQEAGPDTVVATVNGQDITLTHVLDIRRQLPPEYQAIPAAQLFDGIVGQLIQQRVLAAQVSDAPAWLDEAVENTRSAILAGQALGTLGQVEVTEADIAAAYEAQFGSFAGAVEYNASHILVETEEEAAALVEELARGADFAALAMEFSTGPSGPRGGELGWFGAGMMVPPFQAAVEALDVGAVSAPVETQFGWHVITLNETRTEPAPTLESVREDLAGQIQSDALAAELEALIAAAEVSRVDGLDPNILNTVDVFGQ
ncbi:MAG: peptidylprolyl isomerase [Pseudomonadota bacterium]